jgi:hypothetical protein
MRDAEELPVRWIGVSPDVWGLNLEMDTLDGLLAEAQIWVPELLADNYGYRGPFLLDLHIRDTSYLEDAPAAPQPTPVRA